MLVDRTFGADLLTMFTVDYELGGAAQVHDHPFEEAYFFLDGEIEGELDGEHVHAPRRATSPSPASARPTASTTPAAAACAGSRPRRRSRRRGTPIAGSMPGSGSRSTDMSTDGCIVVVGGTGRHRQGAGPLLRGHRARDGPHRPRRRPRPRRSPPRSAARRAGSRFDLAKPKTIRDALASVGPVRYLAIVAIQRDDNTIRDFDIDRAMELVTLKLVGYAEVVHVLLDRLSPDSSIVLFGGQAKDRPYPGSTTVSTVNGGIAGLARTPRLGAGADPGQRHPSGDHRRQPVLARQAARDPRGPPLEDHHQEARDDGRHRRRDAVPAREPVGRRDRPRGRQRTDDVLSMAS